MKKFVSIGLIAVLFAGSIYAADIALGFRGNANFGVGTTLVGEGKTVMDNAEQTAKAMQSQGYVVSVEKGANVGGGFGLYAAIAFSNSDVARVGIQPEVNFNFNNGFHGKISAAGSGESASIEIKAYTHTLDIPVLLTVDFSGDSHFGVGFGIGPQISIPVKADQESNVSQNGVSANVILSKNASEVKAKVNLGMACDFNCKYFFDNSKKSALVLDLRYNLDFTPTKYVYTLNGITLTEEDYIRRGLNLGIGLEARL